ncbi:Glycosyltransferase Family 2 protein [Gigaspora rosea]|uniref:Glycosyltransferase Family 2 protein n=1 Tax=Gigaspora rosea TaxID=44941 RepID=A0A397W709_9GLOM|nr:Glycosyltransferase Family 2 protein [Gigaspora rosea]
MVKHTNKVIERRLKVLITGGCGFIGKNLAKYLHNRGDHVRIVDISRDLTENPETYCTEFILGDLRDLSTCHKAAKDVNWVFHFASNVGGIEYAHELNNFIAYKNEHLITVNIAQASIEAGIDKFFYASSACIYPEEKQLNSGESNNNDPNPQSLYAREKLNSEFFLMESINSTKLRIARLQNIIFGEGNNWIGGKENDLAALIRKAICSIKEEEYYKIEILGSGDQCCNFLYIDDCIDAIIKLMESDYSKPLNIGSENVISIRELAYIAFETIGIAREQVKLITDENKPDVQNSDSDNTLIRQILNWTPKTSIRKGIERMTMCIKDEIENNINKCENESMRKEMKENYRKKSNVAKTLKEGIKFGILLPITSRGLESPEDCLYNLHNFAQSVYETTQVDIMGINGIKFSLKFFIGIDKDDALFHPIEKNIAEQILNEHGLNDVVTREFDLPPGSICTIWHDLAIDAYNQMCDYIVLLGDDIIIESTNWMSKIHEEFIKISNEKKVPCGFGIVAFTEITFPGFPTFPVMSRLQIDIFNGEPFPPIFSNQDADPFLFQLYRRFGCSVMPKRIKLMNLIGGSKKPRYKRIFHDWSFSVLDNAVLTVEKWINNKSKDPIPRLLTLDVVVPTYRVQMQYLEPIIRLKRSNTASTSIIFIVDNPNSPHIKDLKKFEHDAFIRIRVQGKNLGASEARNRGLAESNADYVLFLDDDVIPQPDILIESEKMIRKYPKACGFVGCTKFPDASKTIFTSAVKMAGITYFWDIAEEIEEDAPWGVTANLLVRRCKDVKFDTEFPKTGGGEDVDFCLKKKKFFTKNIQDGEGFRGAPSIKAVHPWWNNGKRTYFRFAKWAYGDGKLIKMYPEHAYKDNFPNSAELLLIHAPFIIIFLLTKIMINNQILNRLTFMTTVSMLLVVIANMIFDIIRFVILEPESYVPNLKGYRRIIAAAESSIVRIASESGRLYGILCRKEWGYIGWRFDWFTGRLGDDTKNIEKRFSMIRFNVWAFLIFLAVFLYKFLIRIN